MATNIVPQTGIPMRSLKQFTCDGCGRRLFAGERFIYQGGQHLCIECVMSELASETQAAERVAS